ncbi:nucleolar complex protein 2 homolog [Ipomoea triloba]|uniref:nucleolar complex protein 2 homolog n=1 Tax=Ipomoea triloba TaxID=35885 RepID=UPI00125D034F|nr:nucleolar complex protein 2 homolog [Ipomoea triloba]
MDSRRKVKLLSKKEPKGEDNQTDTMPDSTAKKTAREHKEQLERLQEKDPEFFEFLKEHDKELLEFNDEEIDDDEEIELDDEAMEDEKETDELEMEQASSIDEQGKKSVKNIVTSEMVDSWCNLIREKRNIGAVRSLVRAFRSACHYGDDSDADPTSKWSTMSSGVFNKIMLFVLNEMDGILRGLLNLPASGGTKQMVADTMTTRKWKNFQNLVKSYLGNALHVLNQMTDTEMISFTLRRLRYSSILLAAFPVLLRKYIKVLLHFWGTGGGALPVFSFLFLRDLCVQLSSDCIDDCIKGMYKAYVLNCQFVNPTKLQHIQFLGNCFIELLRLDLPTAYQHAFVFIRQLAMVLRKALDSKTKESFRKVYEWKYINCLELWTGAICTYCLEADFRPLAYPLTQIISGAARLVPSARYFPLRLRCVKMLNRIAVSTGSFIPVSLLLLDMLEMKELHKPATGGVGKAVDLSCVIKVTKPTLKTRAFQEACVFSVVEELAEHLAQWSYSVAFSELSFVPAVRLRSFCKSTKVERFRREIRQFIRQVEANSEFTNKKRMTVTFLPNDSAASSFLEDEKKAGISPLSKYVGTLRQRAQQRSESLIESSVIVGERSSLFGSKVMDDVDDDDDREDTGDAVFNSSWLPGGNSKTKHSKEKKTKKRKRSKDGSASDEDIVEDLVLSSDEEGSMSDTPTEDNISKKQKSTVEPSKKKGKFKPKKSPTEDISKKQKLTVEPSKKKGKFKPKKSKKRKPSS